MAEERIIISVEAQTAQFQESLKLAGLTLGQLNKQLYNNFQVADKTGKINNKLTVQTNELGRAFRGARKQASGFKFEYLSVMFAGMALDRAFGGLVRTQLELFGVTSLMGDAWTTVMLPIMDLLTPILYSLIEAFMSMPEETKLAIGGFVLLMAAFGTFLAIVGQVVLAMMGFKMIGKDLVFNFKATGYSGLISKLDNLKRIGAAGLGLYMIYKGIKDLNDKPIKGMGEILVGAGLLKYAVKGAGGKYMIVIGFAMMLVGDEEFVVKVMKTFIKLGQFLTKIIEAAFKAAIGIKIDEEDFASFGDAWKKAVEQVSIETGEGAFGMPKKPIFPTATMKDYNAAVDDLWDAFRDGDITLEKHSDKMKKLNIEYAEIREWPSKWFDATKKWEKDSIISQDSVSKNAGVGFKLIGGGHQGLVNMMIPDLWRWVANWDKGTEENQTTTQNYVNDTIVEFARIPKNITTTHTIERKYKGFGLFGLLGGLLGGFAEGGYVPQTGPYLLHQGETVTPANESNSKEIVLNVSYVINVSDKYEMEKLIRENNIKLVNEVRRQIAI